MRFQRNNVWKYLMHHNIHIPPSSVKHNVRHEFFVLFPVLPSSSYLIWNIKMPLLPVHRLGGNNFFYYFTKHLVSDILKVFREVVELNLFMALSLGLFTNVTFSLRSMLDRSAMRIIWHYLALWDHLQLGATRLQLYSLLHAGTRYLYHII